MSRIRLLYVVNEFGESSVSEQVLLLIKGLDRERYDIRIGSVKAGDSPIIHRLETENIPIIHFAAPGQSTIIRAAHYMNTQNIQIVHTHVLRSDLIGGISARLVHKPLLFSTKHNTGYISKQEGWLLRNLFFWSVIYLPDQIITVSDELKKKILSHPRINPRRIMTIHNSVDVGRFACETVPQTCRESLSIAPGETVISYIGRLVEGKGLEILLHAAKQLIERYGQSRFVIVGDGYLRSRLEQLAYELGITPYVLFTGFRRDIAAILQAVDIFVLPSDSEGLPVSLLEAMAAGKAIIATPVGGITEVIQSEVTGLLVPPQDAAALVQALGRLMDNRMLREDLGKKAHMLVCREFSAEHMVAAYDSLYQIRLKESRFKTAQPTTHSWSEL